MIKLFFVLFFIPCALILTKSETNLEFPFIAETAVNAKDTTLYQIISKGKAAGEYQAFPDACRLKNGDIMTVFYAGQGHVTYPNEKYPNAGKVCMVRSRDEGRTWSRPVVIYDDVHDNRDPHISQLSDGTILVTFFSLDLKIKDGKRERLPAGIHIIKSVDNGKTWDKETQMLPTDDKHWYCSAPVREMSDGTLVFPVYHQVQGTKVAWGGVSLSYNKGKSWGDIIPIGKGADLWLAAETDVIRLNDGSLFAALRGQYEVPMHYAISKDMGKTWSGPESIGFLGHSPHLTRLSSGEILLTYRGVNGGKSFAWDRAYTALRISYDDGASWQGPYMMNKSRGAYPSTVELKDKSILLIFYEEGEGSGIGAFRFRKPENENGSPPPKSIELLPFSK